jgi:dolichol-phosphate mannosyltransferase
VEASGVRCVQEPLRGKGRALRRAAKLASGEILVFIDGDGSHDPADIPRLLAPIRQGDADLVVASRFLGGSSELHGSLDSFLRLTGTALLNLCIGWRFGCPVSDSQNGFRAIRRDVFLALDLQSNGFTIEQEMVMNVLAKGYRLQEVASHEHQRKHGVSKIRLWRDWPFWLWSLAAGLCQRKTTSCKGVTPGADPA